MPDTPNPYAFVVAVRHFIGGRQDHWYVYIWENDSETGEEMRFGPFATEADANTHADLVLAALKGATRE